MNCNKNSLFYDCFRERVNESKPIVCCDWCILAARKNGFIGLIINPLLTKSEVKMAECGPFFFFCVFLDLGLSQYPRHLEGNIGGHSVPQYRKKNYETPKYRFESQRNTDTAFTIGHAYFNLYPSRLFVSQACMH